MTSILYSKLTGLGRNTLGLIALLAVLAAVNIIAGNLRLRTDLTQEKLYSLSDGTRRLLHGLDEPVALKLFFSAGNARMPVMLRTYARQVEDLLSEYRIASRGMLTIEKFDPVPDSDEEEWARRYGIAGQAVEIHGAPLYFGLVATAGATEAVLPALDPRMQQLLEYNISRMIQQVTHPRRAVAGVISSLSVLGRQPDPYPMPGKTRTPPLPPWIAFQELQQDFHVRMIEEPENGIPGDIDVLVMLHPKDLPVRARFAIDQYVLRGGHLILFVDPLSVADDGAESMSPYGMPRLDSDLPDLLKAWGIGYQPTRILADFSAATPMRTPDGAGVEHNPSVTTYTAANFNRDSIMTAGLQTLRAAFAGALTDKTDDKLTVTPLIKATAESGTVSAMAVRQGGRALREAFTLAHEPQYLAIQIAGTFRTAFPGGPPRDHADEEQEVDTDGDFLTAGESTVVVIADADMLFDPICVEQINFFGQIAHRPLNDNIAFFANVVESMAGGRDLIAIRSRGELNRPFTRVDTLEAAALTRWREQETQLEVGLREARQQLSQLQAAGGDDHRYILSDGQRTAIERFKRRENEIRRELRNVRRNLRQDIDRLGMRVKTVNIALMPILVAIGGIVYGTRRKRS